MQAHGRGMVHAHGTESVGFHEDADLPAAFPGQIATPGTVSKNGQPVAADNDTAMALHNLG